PRCLRAVFICLPHSLSICPTMLLAVLHTGQFEFPFYESPICPLRWSLQNSALPAGIFAAQAIHYLLAASVPPDSRAVFPFLTFFPDPSSHSRLRCLRAVFYFPVCFNL